MYHQVNLTVFHQFYVKNEKKHAVTNLLVTFVSHGIQFGLVGGQCVLLYNVALSEYVMLVITM